MLLKKVYLKNFISHKSSEVKFDYGINVITGPNGAGKTSILDAVSFGLFNVHSRGKNENLVHRGENRSKVIVEFKEGGIDYVVEWDIDSKTKTPRGILTRVQNGERSIIARGGVKIITPEVEKIIGLDKHLFLQSIYVQQGEIERLVTETPSERKQIISKLLGIEDLEKAYQYMREVVNEYENIVNNLSVELKRKPEVERRNISLALDIEKLRESLKYKHAKLFEIENKLKIHDDTLKALERKKEIFSRLNNQRTVLEINIENLKENLNRKEGELKEAEIALSKVESLREAVAKLPIMNEYLKLFKELNEKEKELKLKREDLQYIEDLLDTMKNNEKSYKSYLEKSALLKQKREERKKYEGANKELERLEKQLQEDLAKLDKKSKELSQRLEEYSQKLGEKVGKENVEYVLAEKKSEIDRLKGMLDEKADRLKRDIGTINGQIEDMKFKLSKISEANVCPICGRELTPEHREKLKGEFEETRRESLEKLGRLEGELKSVNEEKKNCEENLKELALIDPYKIKDISAEIEELDKKILFERSEINKLKEGAEALRKIEDEMNILEREIEELENAKQDYEMSKRELTKRPSKEEIQATLDRIISDMDTISKEMGCLISDLGYRPENPEQELEDLRIKKEEFDRNEPLAKKRDSILTEVESLRQELKAKRIELEKVLVEIRELGYDENVHREIQREFEALMKEKTEASNEVVRLETEIKDRSEEKEKCEVELKLLLEKEREKVMVEEFVRILEGIRGAFHKDGLQRLIRARSTPLLERITRDFLERFNLELSDVQIDDDYNISVIGPAGVQTIDQISGGERVALAIALRLAIARILSEKVETIIMDEPTTHLDEERRKELVNILNSFFKEGGRVIPQMIVITHHQEIEDVADIIYNVRKKEGYSIVETGGA